MMTRIFFALLAVAAVFAASNYQAEIETWRSQRVAKLKAEDGWLSLAGLFWLHEGANPFGKDPKGEIALPDGPARAGVFHLQSGKVTVTIDGATREVKADSDTDIVKVGRLHLFVIKRGDKYAIRLKDPQSEARREFTAIESYPIDESYRAVARWVPERRTIPILTIIGQ